MSRKFKVSSNYDGGPWYDPISQNWFMPGKVTIIEDKTKMENINKYVRRNYLIEINDKEKPLERDTLIRSTASQLLGRDNNKIKEIVEPNLKEEVRVEKKEPEVELDKMTKNDLVEFAESKNIEVDKRTKKETILSAIRKAMNN